MAKTFENLLLLGRPASGKSEFIDFMKKIPVDERISKYHIGDFEELDDFPWIWQKFMEDNIWEKAGYPRRYSSGGENPGLHKEGGALFDFCMAKFNASFEKKYANNETFYQNNQTLFIEFARGGEEAYKKALHQLSHDILNRSVILFIFVSYEESCRRNEARYQEKLKHSILSHKVPDETMSFYYRNHDWLDLTQNKSEGVLQIGQVHLPFVTMNNEPEWTDVTLLDQRYGKALRRLKELKDAHV